MTKQARQVMTACGFPESDLYNIENLMCRYFPKQVINLVRVKDKDGDQTSIEWFLPFFKGYVRQVMDITMGATPEFWKTYDLVCQVVEDFDVIDMPLILELSMDTGRLRVAMTKTKPNLRYLHKVWQGLPAFQGPQTFNTVQMDIRKHEVVKTQLD